MDEEIKEETPMPSLEKGDIFCAPDKYKQELIINHTCTLEEK